MCKEDVRIKRQTDSRTKLVTGQPVTFVEGLPANGGRVTIILSFKGVQDITAGNQVYLTAGQGDNAAFLGGISPQTPSIVLTVEQIGILITLPMFIYGISWDGNPVVMTEVFFTKALGDL